jgi:hypothetical protein
VQSRTIIVGGVLAGLWEVDLAKGRVVTAPFRPLAEKTRAIVDAKAEALAAFFADEIGHARSFNLDTDEGVRERALRVQKLTS